MGRVGPPPVPGDRWTERRERCRLALDELEAARAIGADRAREVIESSAIRSFPSVSGCTGSGRPARHTWPKATREAVEAKEQRAVQVVGYLLKVKLEGQESPNCYSDDPKLRDFHIWLANSPDDDRSDAVVVEVTPRVRGRHESWSLTNLRRFVNQQSRVRISGWLMLDPEHLDQVGKTRATLWEIHPILKIEVWSGNRWRELP